MKHTSRGRKKILENFKKIHLVDKCLILFMAVLMLQSAHNLFFPYCEPAELANIDIIVRTSSAAVFGYFLSANFVRGESKEKRVEKEAPRVSAPIGEPKPKSLPKAVPPDDRGTANRVQIIVAASIGLFCLLTLIILRDVPGLAANIEVSASATATVAQMRDFISGCVGFLIGSPTSRGQKS